MQLDHFRLDPEGRPVPVGQCPLYAAGDLGEGKYLPFADVVVVLHGTGGDRDLCPITILSSKIAHKSREFSTVNLGLNWKNVAALSGCTCDTFWRRYCFSIGSPFQCYITAIEFCIFSQKKCGEDFSDQPPSEAHTLAAHIAVRQSLY